jgi:S-(hydroxymethyl)glutathione dehydrogenase/alcohol dehydrogenase
MRHSQSRFKFKAAILRGEGFVCVETVTCDELPPECVAVKIRYSGICRSQLMEFRGQRGIDKYLPHLFGHEAVGEIIDVGQEVNTFKPGDNVILTWIGANPKNYKAPLLKNEQNEKINTGKIATLSEIAIVHKDCCVIKPIPLSDLASVLFGCALGTGAGMAINTLNLSNDTNKKIVVLGLGGVGLSVLLALHAYGFEKITAVDVNQKKLDWCDKHLEVKSALFTSDWVSNNSDKFDICFEATGTILGIESGFTIISKNGGLLKFASHPPDGQFMKLKPHDLISGKKIDGSWGGGINPKKDFAQMSEIFKPFEDLLVNCIGPIFSLNQIEKALKCLETGNAFRPVIAFEK